MPEEVWPLVCKVVMKDVKRLKISKTEHFHLLEWPSLLNNRTNYFILFHCIDKLYIQSHFVGSVADYILPC